MIVCRAGDSFILKATATLNDEDTMTCTMIEREFLRELLGGCSTPISALAQYDNNEIYFRGIFLQMMARKKLKLKSISIKRMLVVWAGK